MRSWLCPHCGRRGESKDNIVMKICKVCMEEMEVQNADTD